MKKLYKEFYQHSPNKNNSHLEISSPPNSYNKSISEYSEEYESTNQNFYNSNSPNKSERFQKSEFLKQIHTLRQ
jgi:hypothetical protein